MIMEPLQEGLSDLSRVAIAVSGTVSVQPRDGC